MAVGEHLQRSESLRWGWVAVALLAAAAILVNPVGFVGGGNDDGKYLDAARCWLAEGAPCLPQWHWSTRWPVFAPVAASSALFGESRQTVGLGSLLYWAAAIGLTSFLGARWFDRRAGLLAAALLAVTPIFTASALQPSADNAELAFQLAALAAATIAYRRPSRAWAVGAGLLAALALQTRDTSFLFAALAALAWLFLPKERRRVLLWAIPGLALGMAAEMVVYWAAAGDPLFRYRLALGHGAIPSQELPAGFDTSRSPLFNPAYIAAWRRESGIELFWPLDPWLNLLASPKINVTLLAVPVLWAAFGRFLDRGRRRTALRILAIALLLGVLLVYALALDPKPRIFVGLAAACSLVAGALVAAAWRGGFRLAASVSMLAIVALQFTTLVRYPSNRHGEAAARQWIAARGDAIEIDEPARSYLTLLPEARALPGVAADRPLRLTTSLGPCEKLLRGKGGAAAGARLLAARGDDDPEYGQVCLFAYGPGER